MLPPHCVSHSDDSELKTPSPCSWAAHSPGHIQLVQVQKLVLGCIACITLLLRFYFKIPWRPTSLSTWITFLALPQCHRAQNDNMKALWWYELPGSFRHFLSVIPLWCLSIDNRLVDFYMEVLIFVRCPTWSQFLVPHTNALDLGQVV